jgi:hypothetical protein
VTEGEAVEVDERYLKFRSMQDGIDAGRASMAARQDSLDAIELLKNVLALGALEHELREIEGLLEAEEQRLAQIQEDYVGRQQTALIILARGTVPEQVPTGLLIHLEEGESLWVALDEPTKESLNRGGIAQIFQGFVEPRSQWIEVGLGGGGWEGSEHGFLEIEPQRDRLTLVELDLGAVARSTGVMGLTARAWVPDRFGGPADLEADATR